MVPLRTTVLLGLVQLGAGLYFHINEGETKCFIEEVPDETMVVGETFLICLTAPLRTCRITSMCCAVRSYLHS